MNTLRQLTDGDQLDYSKLVDPRSKEELVTAIVVDATVIPIESLRGIRMVGYMNRQAVGMTLQSQLTTFYSRSKGGLWVKGESSGNTLPVAAAYTDCDSDTVLISSLPQGPTCHTGNISCFESEGY